MRSFVSRSRVARARGASGSGRVDRLLRLVRVRRAGVDLQLLQHLRGRAGPSGACAAPRAARPARGRARAGARGSRCGCRPGSRCGGGTACRGALRGDDRELRRVDDDHVVAGVDVRRPDRLVLAAQQRRDLGREAAEDRAFGVDHVPRRVMSAGLGVNVRTRILFRSIARTGETRAARQRRRARRSSRTHEPLAATGPGNRARFRPGRTVERAAMTDALRTVAASRHQIADEHRAEAEAGPRGAARPARSSPIVDMVLTRRDGATRRSPPTAGSRFRRDRRRRLRRRRRAEGRNPLADQSTDRFAAARRRAGRTRTRTATRQRLPVRLRADRPALRLARPRPTSA